MPQCGVKHYRIAIIALWLETLLYGSFSTIQEIFAGTQQFSGLYSVLFAGSIYVLGFQRRRKYYIATSIVIYACITGAVVVHLVQTLWTPNFTVNSQFVGQAYFRCTPGAETPAQVHDAIINNLTNTIADGIAILAQITADGLLIYRCFIIWNRRQLVILPLIALLLATSACNLAAMYYDSQTYEIRRDTSPESGPPPTWFHLLKMSTTFATASYALTLATTVVTTALIAARIWWTSRELGRSLNRSSGSMYKSAIILIVESGALWSSGLIAALIVHHTALQYAPIAGFTLNILLGIAPTLIIVRVGLGHAIETSYPPVHRSTAVHHVFGYVLSIKISNILAFLALTFLSTRAQTEAIAYGIYLTLFTQCIRALRLAPQGKWHWAVAIILFVLGTIVVLLDFLRVTATPNITANSFCTGTKCFSCSTSDAAAVAREIPTNDAFNIVGNVFATVFRFVGVSYLIPASFIPYSHFHLSLIVRPAVSFVRVAAIAQQRNFHTLGSQSSGTLGGIANALGTVRAYTSVPSHEHGLVRPVWNLGKQKEKATGETRPWFDAVGATIVESASIYSVVAVITTLTSVFSPVWAIVPDGIEIQLAGIIPTMIIIRVCLGKSLDPMRLWSSRRKLGGKGIEAEYEHQELGSGILPEM
ncbi:hypothetical protein EVG20_g6554 [Dentipellis fragilis]|uniref:Uncharacterized protein n=1 Tax=Dentipellis fragilis TaxID=205917 RepID=A0A4Y9YL40_9AGAM|nr:hypothetical protein EVG20_g6554 [Dentipellis fragilis]